MSGVDRRVDDVDFVDDVDRVQTVIQKVLENIASKETHTREEVMDLFVQFILDLEAAL